MKKYETNTTDTATTSTGSTSDNNVTENMNADFQLIAKGAPYLDTVIPTDEGGFRFNVTDSGAVLEFCINHPKQSLLEDFSKDISLGIFPYKNVLFMLIKMGNQQWVDAPYSPHISIINKELTSLPVIKKGLRLPIIFYVVDTATRAYATAPRILTPSARFSSILLTQMEDILEDSYWDFQGYILHMHEAFDKWTPKEMSKLSLCTCKA